MKTQKIFSSEELLEQSRLFQLWDIMVKTGIPALEQMESLASSFPRYQNDILEWRNNLIEGCTLANYPFNHPDVFHPIVVPVTALNDFSHFPQLSRHLRYEATESGTVCFYHGYALALECQQNYASALKMVGKFALFPPKNILRKIYTSMENKGVSFGKAVDKYKEYFTPAARTIITGGEMGGNLDSLLYEYVEYLRSQK